MRVHSFAVLYMQLDKLKRIDEFYSEAYRNREREREAEENEHSCRDRLYQTRMYLAVGDVQVDIRPSELVGRKWCSIKLLMGHKLNLQIATLFDFLRLLLWLWELLLLQIGLPSHALEGQMRLYLLLRFCPNSIFVLNCSGKWDHLSSSKSQIERGGGGWEEVDRKPEIEIFKLSVIFEGLHQKRTEGEHKLPSIGIKAQQKEEKKKKKLSIYINISTGLSVF